MNDREALANKVLNGTGVANALDVQIEVALFKPCKAWASVRPNAAGTKVIYTAPNGHEVTRWAPEHTRNRLRAVAELRSLSVPRGE